MQKKFLLLVLAGSLSACSLIERRGDGDVPSNAAEAAADDSRHNGDYLEKEVSRLSAKVEALETKMEVVTNNLEKQQIRSAQPVINAEPATPSAPPTASEAVESTTVPSSVPLHETPVATNSSESLSSTETNFRNAMVLFQSGKNLEAGAAFVNLAHQNSRHHLAPHALYWAGEANARAEQWKLANAAWEELRSKYPHSAYLPDALAGLVRSYGALGETNQAGAVRASLLRSFPQAPAALNLQTTSPTPIRSRTASESMNDDVPADHGSQAAEAPAAKEVAEPMPEAPFKEEPISEGNE